MRDPRGEDEILAANQAALARVEGLA